MEDLIQNLINSALKAAQKAGELPKDLSARDTLERPDDVNNGDWSSTIAMKSAKIAHMAPRQIADCIISHLKLPEEVERVEVAGPGFINFYLSDDAITSVFAEVRDQDRDYGRTDLGHGQKIEVEYVSANPTGPLHIGHGRWAAIGDSLCNVLEFEGFDVTREYYVNDHGSQIDVFGRSVALRYEQIKELMSQGSSLEDAVETLIADREAALEDEENERPHEHPFYTAFGETLGNNSYGGDYVIELAVSFIEQLDGTNADLSYFTQESYKAQLRQIQQTCEHARAHFDVWKSESSFYEGSPNAVQRVLAKLDEQGLIRQDDDGSVWFLSTRFGDDKDRCIIKSNGEMTYFASDVAYTLDKFERDDYVINVLGADHHGYIKRVQAVAEALGHKGKYEVLLGQFVNLLRNGEPVRMSKRRGTMVSFDELLDEVGPDATRYTLISKSSNQPIDFDIALAQKQDSSNPVYYVQYAHARICSILRRAHDMGIAIGPDPEYQLLTHPTEITLARTLAEFPELLISCAQDRAPFRITHYAERLAGEFHHFYKECQVLPKRQDADVDPAQARSDQEVRDDDASGAMPALPFELSRARLAACDAVRIVLQTCLRLIGVLAPETM